MKKFWITMIACLLVILVGVIGVFVNSAFFSAEYQGKSAIISVDYLKDDEYIELKKDINKVISDSDAKPVSVQPIKDLYDMEKGLCYMFNDLTDAQTNALSELVSIEGIRAVTIGKVDNTSLNKVLLWSGIALAIILVLTFVAYVVLFKKTNRIMTALSVILVVALNVLTTIGIISIMSLIGIKATVASAGVILAIAVFSIILSLLIFTKIRQSEKLNSTAVESVLVDNKKPMLFSTIILLLACVGFAVLGTNVALSFAIPFFFGILATYSTCTFALIPIWQKFSGNN